MAFTNEILPKVGNDVPPYFIYREGPVGQPADPTAPLVFFPPKESDELFDALRIAFPHLKSHSERMREAVITFFMEEQQAEQLQTTMAMPSENLTMPTDNLTISASTLTSPWEQSWPSMSSGSASTFSSPQTLGFATPTFGMSPMPQHPNFSRQFSTASTTAPTPSNSEQNPPALENMTGVFSVSAGDQPKQRVRRKMTEAEKIEYRNRRIVKACDKCSKRKRKCTHNQPEMETLATKQKVTKRTSPTSTQAKPTTTAQKVQQSLTDLENFENFDFDAAFGGDMQLFDDFTNVYERPTQQFDYTIDGSNFFDQDLLMISAGGPTNSASAQRQLRWDQQLKWQTPSLSPTDSESVAQGGLQDQRVTSGALEFDQQDVGSDFYRTRDNAHFSTINTRRCRHEAEPNECHWEDLRTGHRRAPHQQNDQESGANSGMLWEHLRTGQIEPTHTRHVHDAEGQASYVFDSSGRAGIGGSGDCDQHRSPIAKEVMKLTGTAKAIRAFGKLLKSNGPKRISLQLVALSSVAAAIAQSVPQTHGFGRTNKFLLPGAPAAARVPQISRNSDEIDTSVGRHARFEAANGPLEGMQIGDYLRMQQNFDDIEGQIGRGGQALPSMTGSDAKFWPSSIWAGSSCEDMRSTSVSISSGPVSTDSEASHNQGRRAQSTTSTSASSSSGSSRGESEAHDQQGRPAFTIGESIDRAQSPTTELFMAKRRIPKSLHSVNDRGALATGLTPLLQQGGPDGDWKAAMIISRCRVRGEIFSIGQSVPRLKDTQVDVEASASNQANGGAYLRLDAAHDNRPSATTLDTSIQPLGPSRNRTTPEQADASSLRSQTPSSGTAAKSESASGIRIGLPTSTDQRVEAGGKYMENSAATTSASAAYKGNARGALQHTHESEEEEHESANTNMVYVVKKRDTFRRRDHFGRMSAGSKQLGGQTEQDQDAGGNCDGWSEVRSNNTDWQKTFGRTNSLNAMLTVLCCSLFLTSILPAADAYPAVLLLLALAIPTNNDAHGWGYILQRSFKGNLAVLDAMSSFFNCLRAAIGHGVDPGHQQQQSKRPAGRNDDTQRRGVHDFWDGECRRAILAEERC